MVTAGKIGNSFYLPALSSMTLQHYVTHRIPPMLLVLYLNTPLTRENVAFLFSLCKGIVIIIDALFIHCHTKDGDGQCAK